MTYSILTTLMKYVFWSHKGLDTAHTDGETHDVDAVTSNFVLSISLRVPTTKVIWDARTFIAGAFLGLVAIIVVRYARSPRRKLPPSPRGFPIIRNALQASDLIWLISKDCKERFGEDTVIYCGGVLSWSMGITGEVMYLDAAGQLTIVLNSLKSSIELLERRAINYSDRPRLIMAQDVLSQGPMLSLTRHSDR